MDGWILCMVLVGSISVRSESSVLSTYLMILVAVRLMVAVGLPDPCTLPWQCTVPCTTLHQHSTSPALGVFKLFDLMI